MQLIIKMNSHSKQSGVVIKETKGPPFRFIYTDLSARMAGLFVYVFAEYVQRLNPLLDALNEKKN